MARLLRPHIPFDVRCRVAMRQLGLTPEQIERHLETQDARNSGMWYIRYLNEFLLPRLRSKLGVIGLHLDHDPALENRRKVRKRAGGDVVYYDPDANDPDYLIYREGGFTGSAHDIKTRIRGEHGQLSDHALARKEKNRQRKLTRRKKPFPKGRKLQSRNTFHRRSK